MLNAVPTGTDARNPLVDQYAARKPESTVMPIGALTGLPLDKRSTTATLMGIGLNTPHFVSVVGENA